MRKTHYAQIAFISVCLGFCVSYISMTHHPRFEHHLETVRNTRAVLEGGQQTLEGRVMHFPQYYSRIIFPAMLIAASKTHTLSDSQWYMILRIATSFVAFAAFLLLCTEVEGTSVKLACCGAGALAYAMVFTFNRGWEHPTDFLDVTFTAGMIWLTFRKRRIALVVLVLIATLNHQTAAFASVIWFFVWGHEGFVPKWLETAYAAALGASSYVLASVVTKMNTNLTSMDFGSSLAQTLDDILDIFYKPNPFIWPFLLVAMVLPAVVWLVSNRAVVTGNLQSLVWAAIAITLLGLPIITVSELRSGFLQPMVILTFAAVASEHRMQQQSLQPIPAA